MNPYLLIAPLGGAAAVAGLLLLGMWIRGLNPERRARTRESKVLGSGVQTERRKRVRNIAISVVVALVVWKLTGWPIGGIAAGAGAFFIPLFFNVGRITAKRIDKLEALEEWVRRIADAMAAGGAATATIVRSAERAPAEIRAEVQELASRLSTPRWNRVVALKQFANRIDDSLADLIETSLEIAVSARVSDRVPTVLRQVADAAAEEVKARRQIEVERNAPRNEARVLVVMVILAVVGLVTFTNFTSVYSTPVGQIFIGILAVMMGGALWMIRQLSLGEKTPRVLAAVDQDGENS